MHVCRIKDGARSQEAHEAHLSAQALDAWQTYGKVRSSSVHRSPQAQGVHPCDALGQEQAQVRHDLPGGQGYLEEQEHQDRWKVRYHRMLVQHMIDLPCSRCISWWNVHAGSAPTWSTPLVSWMLSPSRRLTSISVFFTIPRAVSPFTASLWVLPSISLVFARYSLAVNVK